MHFAPFCCSFFTRKTKSASKGCILIFSLGERPYKCPHCDYAGTQSGSLKYHLQRHHREQRNALAASSNSSSAGLPSSVSSLSSGSSGLKQRRSQVGHSSTNRSSADSSASRSSQQAWLLGLPDQREHRKALEALRGVDLETQYRYLSGVMGALYQGGMEGTWIRGSPPPKAAKVSRRKPLTTSRMVQPVNDKEGSVSSTQEGGFEPLDLSRRPSPAFGGMEEDGGIGPEEGGINIGDVAGDNSTGVKLSQCLFCPFRTSSTELMAMHLQVNHTSKSRRKRGPSSVLDDETQVAIKAQTDHSDFHSLWRHLSESESQAPLEDWSSAKSNALNGLGNDPEGHLENILDCPDSNVASASHTAKDDPRLQEKMEYDEEQEEELEEESENGSFEDLQDQSMRMSFSVSPALSANQES